MDNLVQDLRYALRQFRKSPGFTFTAIFCLTLSIGATTAIFSVVYGVLIDPYPYKDAKRMVHVELRDKGERRGQLLFVSGTEAQQLQREPYIDEVFLQQGRQEVLTGNQFPISVRVGKYSPNLFTYMGVPPALGREFTPSDAPGSNAAPVAVLSYLFWNRQFGGSKEAIGKTLELDHTLYTVIGVAPPRFAWGDSDVYVPAVASADPHDYWNAFVKLRPGTSYAAAAARLQILVDTFANPDPKDFRRNKQVAIVSLNEEVLGKFAGTLTLLFAAVLALLLIGCANVSILLLAQGNSRQHELAVRASVGAGRGRIVRQLLTESVLLALAGAALGVIAAYKGVDQISARLPFYSFPHEAAIHVSGPVLAFSAGIAVITGILFGISPAWRLSRPDLGQLIQANTARTIGTVRERNLHRLLIGGQVALTLLLLACAGAAMKAFVAMTHTPLGFDPENIVEFDISLPKGAHPSWQERVNVNESVRQAVEQTPGVALSGVSTSWYPPFGGFVAPINILGSPNLGDAQAQLALVSPQIFSTLHVPLLRGRIFDDGEVMRGAHLALVNQVFVKQFLPNVDPIGQSVRSAMLKIEQPGFLFAESPDDWLQIVGVVADARNDGLDRPIKPAVFLPYSFVLPPDESIFARSAGDPETAIRSVKQRLQQLNPEIVVSQDHTMEWWMEAQSWGQGRFIATLFSLFAFLALTLAATGLYSIVSCLVTQRTQEFGVRMALGAQRSNIMRLVIASTATTLAAGLIAGMALSVAFGGIVQSWVHGNSRDPLTLVAAALVLVPFAALACIVPAWRAASIHPMEALRTE